jgi:hypothetical protein
MNVTSLKFLPSFFVVAALLLLPDTVFGQNGGGRNNNNNNNNNGFGNFPILPPQQFIGSPGNSQFQGGNGGVGTRATMQTDRTYGYSNITGSGTVQGPLQLSVQFGGAGGIGGLNYAGGSGTNYGYGGGFGGAQGGGQNGAGQNQNNTGVSLFPPGFQVHFAYNTLFGLPSQQGQLGGGFGSPFGQAGGQIPGIGFGGVPGIVPGMGMPGMGMPFQAARMARANAAMMMMMSAAMNAGPGYTWYDPNWGSMTPTNPFDFGAGFPNIGGDF